MNNKMFVASGEDDAFAIVALVKKFFNESPYRDMNFSGSKIIKLAEEYCKGEDPLKVALITYDYEGNCIGALIGHAAPVLFSDDLVASELMWYVEPQHRTGRVAMHLLGAFERWSEIVGCKYIQMQSLNDLTPLDKLYQKRGYKPTEKAFIKEL